MIDLLLKALDMITQLSVSKLHPVYLVGVGHRGSPLIQLNHDSHDLVEQYSVALKRYLMAGASLLIVFINRSFLIILDKDFIEFRMGHRTYKHLQVAAHFVYLDH